jgi:hypothetical protein
MKQVLDKKTDRELSVALQIDSSLLSRAKKSGKIPLGWIYTLETKFGVRKDYLETGKGEPFMLGPSKLSEDPTKKWATAVFSANGEEQVYSEHPIAGIVTNASGLALPVHHYAEYVLALEVRGKLDAAGALQLTGSGLPLPRERVKRWQADAASLRSLKIPGNLVVFDLSQTEETEGRQYVVTVGDVILTRRYVVGPDGPEFVPLTGEGPPIPAADGSGRIRTFGRIILLCMET